MASSRYELMLPEARKSIAATAHDFSGHPARGKWHNLACFGAGGGLWTTPTDLASFGIEISEAYKGKTGKIISPQSAKVLLTPHSDAGELGRQVKRYLPQICSQHTMASDSFCVVKPRIFYFCILATICLDSEAFL